MDIAVFGSERRLSYEYRRRKVKLQILARRLRSIFTSFVSYDNVDATKVEYLSLRKSDNPNLRKFTQWQVSAHLTPARWQLE